MDLKQSLTLEALKTDDHSGKVEKRLTAVQVARRVFKISAEAGSPYEGITPEQWAAKWLASKEFVLMTIPTNRVAAVRSPRSQNQVIAQLHASSQEPIVVDLNKRELGKSITNYVPPVIAVDGLHRHRSRVLQGHENVEAWVGVKAINLVTVRTIHAAELIVRKHSGQPPATRVSAAALLHAAVSMGPVPRQDVGDGGSSPTMKMPTVNRTGAAAGSKYIRDRGVKAGHKAGCMCADCSSKRMKAGGPGSGRHKEVDQVAQDKGYRPYGQTGKDSAMWQSKGGQTIEHNADTDKWTHLNESGNKTGSGTGHESLREHIGQAVKGAGGGAGGTGGTGGPGGATSGMNPNLVIRSDGSDSSDRGRTPQDPSDVGQSADPSDRVQSPEDQSPGSGVGPRMRPSKGASNSDMQKLLAGPIKVKRITTKKRGRK